MGGDDTCDHRELVRGKKGDLDAYVIQEGSARDGLPAGGTKGKQLDSVSYRDTCGKCGARRTDQQLGLEPTPDEYVARMVAVFREVRRVLRQDGTLWLNMGDSYAGSWGAQSRGLSEPDARVSGQDLEKSCDSRLLSGSESLSANQIAAAPKRTNTGSWVNNHPALKPKDLVGIPWRLAFALQQPWERHAIKDATDRAWMAGLMDGEGCVSVVAVQPTTGLNESHSMRVQIRMADVEAVERVVAITGMSNVTYDLDTGQGARPAQQWKISGDKAADVLADIYPWLTVKRRQAIVGWNLQRLKDGIVTKRGQPIPQENMAKRRLLHDVLRKLNQREPVDIPSWCREPFVETEPGWYLRSDVIWAKPNPMPESVTDRPTKSHEYLFLLTRSPRYFFDQEAVREPAAWERWGDQTNRKHEGQESAAGWIGSKPKRELVKRRTVREGIDVNGGGQGSGEIVLREGQGRNIRSVWEIPTQPFPGAHFATFPQALVERCLKAGCPESGVVLDPFMGSGTTALVARNLGRRSVGIELNREYAELAARRLQQLSLLA